MRHFITESQFCAVAPEGRANEEKVKQMRTRRRCSGFTRDWILTWSRGRLRKFFSKLF